MPLFNDPKEEDRICQILKAYVEEWGPENVTVLVPSAWQGQDNSSTNISGVKIYCSTEDTVSILVNEGGQPKCNYTVRVNQVVPGQINDSQ